MIPSFFRLNGKAFTVYMKPDICTILLHVYFLLVYTFLCAFLLAEYLTRVHFIWLLNVYKTGLEEISQLV